MKNKTEQIIGDCKITITVEKLTEEKKEQPKPEPKEAIKLYCVKSYNSGLAFTKGKTYIFAGGIKNYDNGDSDRDDEFESYECYENGTDPKLRDCLFPLVKRPAKVGEWVLVTESDGKACNQYKNGDLLEILDVDYEGDAIYKIKDCGWYFSIFDTEYLVIDGYKGDPEAERKDEEIAELKAQKTEIEAKIKELSD